MKKSGYVSQSGIEFERFEKSDVEHVNSLVEKIEDATAKFMRRTSASGTVVAISHVRMLAYLVAHTYPDPAQMDDALKFICQDLSDQSKAFRKAMRQ